MIVIPLQDSLYVPVRFGFFVGGGVCLRLPFIYLLKGYSSVTRTNVVKQQQPKKKFAADQSSFLILYDPERISAQ